MKGLLYYEVHRMSWPMRLLELSITVLFWTLGTSQLLTNKISAGGWFFQFYPALLVGIESSASINQERSDHWDLYAAALPVSRRQLMGAKYIWALATGLAVTLVHLLLNLIVLAHTALDAATLLVAVPVVDLVLSLLLPAVTLPVFARLVGDAARVVAVLTTALAAGFLAAILVNVSFTSMPLWLGLVLLAVVALLFPLSWHLSNRFFARLDI